MDSVLNSNLKFTQLTSMFCMIMTRKFPQEFMLKR